ncbi:MAG: DUF5777 family beta-barrel protein [Balneolales bacterium]
MEINTAKMSMKNIFSCRNKNKVDVGMQLGFCIAVIDGLLFRTGQRNNFIQKNLAGLLAGMILLTGFQQAAEAQITRERVQRTGFVDKVFWAPNNVGITTIYNIPSGNLNTTVMHTFGLVNGGINRFFGLDDGANTRLGFDYGITDRFSAGIGRMTFNKVVDVKGKYNILRQTISDSTPIELAVKVSVGISTASGTGWSTSERLSYFSSLMIARKFNRLSLQLTPMGAHFNRTAVENPARLYGLGILANYDLNDRFSISAEYLPVIGKRHSGTQDALSMALNIDTGGHIFQLFFASSQWHNEQYIMANNKHCFWEGDFRFGFNINRVFWLSR